MSPSTDRAPIAANSLTACRRLLRTLGVGRAALAQMMQQIEHAANCRRRVTLPLIVGAP